MCDGVSASRCQAALPSVCVLLLLFPLCYSDRRVLAGSTSPVQLENSLVPGVKLRSEPLRCPGPLRSAALLSAGPAFPAAAPWLCVIHLLFPKAVNETVWAPRRRRSPARLPAAGAVSFSQWLIQLHHFTARFNTPPIFSN